MTAFADYGFGSGLFGASPFGRADLSKNALWELTVPERNKDDDAAIGGDLEDTLEAFGWLIDAAVERADSFPNLGDPVTALSGSENRIDLDVLSVDLISDGQFRVTLQESSRELVESIFPRSFTSGGTPRQDGWVAVLAGEFYRINRVRYHDEDADPYGAPTLDVLTSESIGSVLTVQPPDLLSLLGSNVSTLVDRADPPDYTRRALLSHRLVRDLKVSERMFALIGRLYGFDIEAVGLFCISESIYNGLLLTNPQDVFIINGKYFTSIALKGFRFDEIPLDIMPLDLMSDVTVFSGTLLSAEEVSTNRWCIGYSMVEDACFTSPGPWKLIDADGVEHWIEEVAETAVSAEDTGVTTDGTTGPFAVSALELPITPGSLSISFTQSGAPPVAATATDDGFGLIIGDATGTVDYNTGAISFTSGVATLNLAPVTLDYTQKRLCVIADPQPTLGAGSLKAVARPQCSAVWKPAAAYRIVATPSEVLSEAGADISRLVDRIEAKIDVQIPIHIRQLVKVFRTSAEASVFVTGQPELLAGDLVNDLPQVDAITGDQFDVIDLDSQNLDTGLFIVTGTQTITP